MPTTLPEIIPLAMMAIGLILLGYGLCEWKYQHRAVKASRKGAKMYGIYDHMKEKW